MTVPVPEVRVTGRSRAGGGQPEPLHTPVLTRRVCCPPGSRMLSSVASLEAPLICCLGPLIHYLQEFNLERVLRSQRSGNVHGSRYACPPATATGRSSQITFPPFVI